MNSYTYRITETLVREVTIQGNSIVDARDRVQQMYNDEDIVLTADNHVNTNFQLIRINNEPISVLKHSNSL